MKATSTPTPELIWNWCEQAARRKLALFVEFPDIDLDDLTQHAYAAILSERPRYDEGRGTTPSTFIQGIAGRRIIDLLRAKSSRCRAEKVMVEVQQADTGQSIDEVDTSLPIGEFAQQVYRHASIVLRGRHPGTRPKRFGMPYRATVIALHHRGVSQQGTRLILSERLGIPVSTRQYISRIIRQHTSGNQTNNGVAMKRNGMWLVESAVADLIGVHYETLKSWRRNGDNPIPYRNVNGNIRYLRSDVEAYLERVTVKAKA